ncbi:MAG TPA: hypothetical protein DCL66_01575, partial [Gammaproteobacteria bacterium]|nr:hypothetical protein [Gammaproteobacteria bacterium]
IKPYAIDNDKKDRGLGTIKHSWIQQICTKGVHWFTELSVDVFKRITEMKLKEMGIIATREDLEMAYRVILGMINDQDTRNVMTRITDVEVEINSKKPGQVSAKKLIVDASYIDELGARVVIDWKTSSPKAGETEESFMRREAERYREKMSDYAEIYQKIDGGENTGKLQLYFVQIRKLMEIPMSL